MRDERLTHKIINTRLYVSNYENRTNKQDSE